MVVFRHKGLILSSFWGEYPPANNPVFHGLVAEVPPNVLPSFLRLAALGGADLHITLDLLSEAGSMASVPCPRHAKRERWSNFLIYLPRVGKSTSLSDYTRWVR
jgi:hypothetical protein